MRVASLQWSGMSLFKQLISKSEPAPNAHKHLEGKPYASLPKSGLASTEFAFSNPQAPQFCNAISLKTMDHNLFLQFGFIQANASEQDAPPSSLNSAIVLSSDTAKQLFCALAELFECEIQPQS